LFLPYYYYSCDTSLTTTFFFYLLLQNCDSMYVCECCIVTWHSRLYHKAEVKNAKKHGPSPLFIYSFFLLIFSTSSLSFESTDYFSCRFFVYYSTQIGKEIIILVIILSFIPSLPRNKSWWRNQLILLGNIWDAACRYTRYCDVKMYVFRTKTMYFISIHVSNTPFSMR